MFSRNHKLFILRKLNYLPYVEKALPVPALIERYDKKEGLLTTKSRSEAIGRIHQFGYKSPELDYKIMKAGLQYAVNACQNALVNGDKKKLSQMFCDDKDSQENAKQIKTQWEKFSKSDKKLLKNNISEDLRVNRIRYVVKVGADDRSSTCYLLLSAQCFQDWHAAIPNYYTEAREDDNSIMAKQREDLKTIEDGLGEGKDKPPGYGTVLMFTIQMRQILRTNIDGKSIDGDGEWLFHYFGWPNPSDTTYFALKMDPTHGFGF